MWIVAVMVFGGVGVAGYCVVSVDGVIDVDVGGVAILCYLYER